MKDLKIKTLVKGTTAKFVEYRDGDLWYSIRYLEYEGSSLSKEFKFPIPTSDTGTRIFPAEIKAITLMRWADRHLRKIQSGEWQ